jgi:zinc protease
MIKKSTLIFLVIFTLGATTMADSMIHKTLDNGLEVILIEDSLSPIISARTFVRAGSIDEENLLGTGASHFLEHLVAGGSTSKRNEDEYKALIATLGGAFNAYTTLDHTSYFINTTAEYTNSAIDILCEWMFYNSINTKEFNREQKVITKEIEKNDASLGRKIYQFNQTNFYKTHAIRYPVIGYQTNFDSITQDQLMAYYKKYYVPSNMILVVGGPLSAEKTFTHIEASFGQESQKSKPIRPFILEPQAFSARVHEKEDKTMITHVSLRFATVDLNSPDLYPLDLLDYILDNGEDSILYKELVEEKKLAFSASASSYTPDFTNGYFEIHLEVDYKNKDAAIAACMDIIESIKDGNISKKDIEKAKKQKIAEKILGINGIEDKVNEAGQSFLYGHDKNFFDVYTESFKAVTKKELMTAASTYLKKDRMIVSIVTPLSKKDTEKKETKRPSTPEADVVKLTNGPTVVFLEDLSLPKTHMQIMTLGGIRLENKQKNGIGHLMMDIIGQSSKKFKKQEIRDKVEGNGADIGGSLGQNTFFYSLNCLSEDTLALSDVLLDTYLHPNFMSDDIEESKRQILKGIEQRQDDWNRYSNYQFKKAFFNDHPYGLPLIGEKQSVDAISEKDLKAHHKYLLNADNTVITVIGVFDRAKMLELIKTTYATITPPQITLPSLPREEHTQAIEIELEVIQDVAALYIGFDGIKVDEKDDNLKLDLVDSALSGLRYPGGRLHNILRENGYVYMVHASNRPGIENGAYSIVALTSSDKIQDVKHIILEQVKDLSTTLLSDKEFNEAIAQLNFYVQDRATSNESKATLMATDILYGRGHDYYLKVKDTISSLTKEDLRDTAKKYLDNPQVYLFEKKKI